MSKLFFDYLVDLKDIDKEIKKVAKTSEEREELWLLVDETIHHKVIGCILDKLPRENHEEFLGIFCDKPHDEKTLFEYLKKQIGDNIESLIRQEIGDFSANLLEEIKSSS